REKGTLEQLLVTPIDPLGLMLGKLAPYLFVGILEMAGVLTVMRWIFDVPIRGNLLFLFAMALVYLFALLAVGLFISTRAETQAQAQQMAQFLFLPSVFLSGYIFPAAGLPWLLRTIGRFLPATHMIEIMRGVVLRDAGPRELLQRPRDGGDERGPRLGQRAPLQEGRALNERARLSRNNA